MGRFAFALGLVGVLIGAVFGAIDANLMGAVVGGFVLGLFAAVCGEILDLLITPLFGDKEDRKAWKWVARAIGVVLLVIAVHELYWAVNLTSLTADHNIGARITHLIARGDSAKAVQDFLAEKRWQ